MPERTLLCLSSIIRDFSRVALDSLIRNLLPNLPGELVILGHSPPGNEKLIEVLRPHCRQLIWKFEADPSISADELSMNLRAESRINVVKNNLLQWNSIAQCERLKQEFEAQNGRADLVAWTRPDLLYLWDADIPRYVPPGLLYLSPHDMWRGFNDRLSIGDSATMSKRMQLSQYFRTNWYPRLVGNPDQMLGGPGTNWNPEDVLGCFLKENGIKVRESYTHFCRLREIQGQIYGIIPHRNSARYYFPEIVENDDRGPVRDRFNKQFQKLMALSNSRGSLMDPRAIRYITGPRQFLQYLMQRGDYTRRLVPLERLLKLETTA